MYKSYRAYAGAFPENREGIEATVTKINNQEETIISVVSVGPDHVWVIIITED